MKKILYGIFLRFHTKVNVRTLLRYPTKAVDSFQAATGSQMGIIALPRVCFIENNKITLKLEDNVMLIIGAKGAWLLPSNVQMEQCLNL